VTDGDYNFGAAMGFSDERKLQGSPDAPKKKKAPPKQSQNLPATSPQKLISSKT
jgi:hypothetical protein